jgi:hypothetical protein
LQPIWLIDGEYSLMEALFAGGAVAGAQLSLGGDVFSQVMAAGVPYNMIAPLYTAGAAGVTALVFYLTR